MFCPHCGAHTKDSDAWCPTCGAILPGSQGWSVERARPRGLMGLAGEPGIRLLAYAFAGLVAVLIVGEVLRLVVALILPALFIVAILYWARERRRRFYDR
jgi:hypothetical protein